MAPHKALRTYSDNRPTPHPPMASPGTQQWMTSPSTSQTASEAVEAQERLHSALSQCLATLLGIDTTRLRCLCEVFLGVLQVWCFSVDNDMVLQKKRTGFRREAIRSSSSGRDRQCTTYTANLVLVVSADKAVALSLPLRLPLSLGGSAFDTIATAPLTLGLTVGRWALRSIGLAVVLAFTSHRSTTLLVAVPRTSFAFGLPLSFE